MRKRFAVAALALALTVGSAMTSFAAGFTHTSDGWRFQWDDNGNYCVDNWVHYRNHWFYFGPDGIMDTGWILKDGKWYFAADTGELQTGFLKINGNVYYMDGNSCALFTGQKEFNGRTYTFTENRAIDGQPYIYTEWNSDGTIRRGTKFGYYS